MPFWHQNGIFRDHLNHNYYPHFLASSPRTPGLIRRRLKPPEPRITHRDPVRQLPLVRLQREREQRGAEEAVRRRPWQRGSGKRGRPVEEDAIGAQELQPEQEQEAELVRQCGESDVQVEERELQEDISRLAEEREVDCR